MRIDGQLVRRETLTPAQREQMFALMTSYYANMDRAYFDRDLDEKQWVILVTAPQAGPIRGFSTQTLLDVVVQGRPVRALFSGDTIVHQEYRGHNPFARLWGRLALSLIETSRQQELYWFLITKGYKTYRFLPVFFREFYPRFDAVTPPACLEVMHALGELKYPENYDRHDGIVRSNDHASYLHPDVADVNDQRLRDPHVAFFARRNPGHVRGDELCCLAPLSRELYPRRLPRHRGTSRDVDGHMNAWPYLLNTAWMWSCAGQRRAFETATKDVARAQAEVLREILRRNRGTTYGLTHAFESIQSPADYQRRVPLTTYDDYRDAIGRISAGENNVLTRDRVRLLEPTSGTTRGEKLIPYTSALRAQFQRAIAAWIGNLFHQRPAVRNGRAYWSISPAFGKPRTTAGNVPIGFDDDTAYLGGAERLLINRLLAVPASVAKLEGIDPFRYATLFHLMLADDLSLISVWNPTFLIALVDSLEAWTERICYDLRRGQLSCLTSADGTGAMKVRVDRRRRLEVESILRSNALPREKVDQLWKRLALISCWTDAAAATGADELAALFPAIEIQPKGLFATEGAVSLPLAGRPGAALALRSHFFEFRETDDLPNISTARGDYRLGHELTEGGRFEVVMTTGGGLYRYRLHDIVEVVGFENQCPLLKFCGKSNRVTDLVGEKLSEPHVRDVLDRAFAEMRITARFALVVPIPARPPHYRLYVQSADLSSRLMTRLAKAVQRGLEENPYYRQAIRLRQLAPLELQKLEGDPRAGWSVYERVCLARGQKPGDIKPTALDGGREWTEAFAEPQADGN